MFNMKSFASMLVKCIKKSWKIIVPICMAITLIIGYLVYNFNSVDVINLKKSVLLLRIYDFSGNIVSSGSGFIAFDSNILITNAHVIEEVVKDSSYQLEVISEQNKTYKVLGILGYSKNNDYAIIKLENQHDVEPLNVTTSRQKIGSNIFTIGSPLGLRNTVSDGIISNYYDETDQRYQFTAPISPGSSGGALINKKGEVVGITYASMTDGQNLNLAIPIKYIKNKYEEVKNNIPVDLAIADDLYKDLLNDGTALPIIKAIEECDYNMSSIVIKDMNDNGYNMGPIVIDGLTLSSDRIYSELGAMKILNIEFNLYKNMCRKFSDGGVDLYCALSSNFWIEVVEPKIIDDNTIDIFNKYMNEDHNVSTTVYLSSSRWYVQYQRPTEHVVKINGHTNKYLYHLEYNVSEVDANKIEQALSNLK